MSDGWQGSTDGAPGTSSVDNHGANLGTIDESLSLWPTNTCEETAVAEQAATFGDDFAFALEEQGLDQPVQLDDFSALWDWEPWAWGHISWKNIRDFFKKRLQLLSADGKHGANDPVEYGPFYTS